MILRIKIFTFFTSLMLVSLFLFSACQENDPGDTEKATPGIVFFRNFSGYTVDVYEYWNPDRFDPTTLVCTIGPVDTQSVERYPSANQTTGTVFYVRYRVLLPFDVGMDTTQVFAHAERVLFNIGIVIKSGETFYGDIQQPAPGELRVINSYILVYNNTNTPIQVRNGNTPLPRYDKTGIYINTGGRSYYEREFTYYDTTLSINDINASTTTGRITFPSFTMERGKIYEFNLQEDRVTGPVVRNILTE